MKIPKLMQITDGHIDKDLSWALQLRNKTMEARKLWELALDLRKITADRGIFFSINDRIDIALAVEADGVHLPEMGLSPQIPKKLKNSMIVGVSVHSLEAARKSEGEGADYLLFGPVFETPSKTGPPQGLCHLEKVAQKLSIPVLAVGGITPLNFRSCLEAGAYGVAAIRAFQ